MRATRNAKTLASNVLRYSACGTCVRGRSHRSSACSGTRIRARSGQLAIHPFAIWVRRKWVPNLLYLLGTSLPFAVGIAVSPIPIIAIVAILSIKPQNALPFTIAWILGLLALCLSVFLIPGLDETRGEPTVLSGWIRQGIGVLLAIIAGNKWSKRNGENTKPRRIISRIDAATPWGVFGWGLILSAPNPKAIALTFAGAANIDAYSLGPVQQTIALGIFVLVASVTVIGPIIGKLSFPDRSSKMLCHLNDWLTRHNNAISASVFALFSILLVVW
jgi:Sap, sulfolipid-1-addressing protein